MLNLLRIDTISIFLSHEQQEIHGGIISTEATDALLLMHQAISTHSYGQTIFLH